MGLAEQLEQTELRNWQLEKMRLGLQQAQNNEVCLEQDILRVFNKFRVIKVLS